MEVLKSLIKKVFVIVGFGDNIMINRTMSMFVANSPWRVLLFFPYWLYFLIKHREGPLGFHSNYLLDIVKHYNFIWNNIVCSKIIKRERTLIFNLYLTVSFFLKKTLFFWGGIFFLNWISNLSDIKIICKTCNREMILESSYNDVSGIYGCMCGMHVLLEVKK